MKPSIRTALLAASCCLAFAGAMSAAVAPDADGFVPLFNGRDLSGWKNVNCAPETWGVRDGKIVCTGHPIGALRTERQYENFVLEFDWRHLESGGNSGMFAWASAINPVGVHFLRAIEIQALDEGYIALYEKRTGKKGTFFSVHGDVFAIQGSEMNPIGRVNGKRSAPTEDRSLPSPQWNHYRVEANDGKIRLHVNGKQVSGGDDCNYRKGYLGLESEGAPVEFRNLRIKELPSTGAAADVTAPVDLGWRSLFNGLDLRGWKTNAATNARWSVAQENLTLKAAAPASALAPASAPGTAGNAAAPGAKSDATLWTTEDFGAAEFVIDYQPPKAGKAESATTPVAATAIVRGTPVTLIAKDGGKFSRFIITVQGSVVRVQTEGRPPAEIALPATAPARGPLGLAAGPGAGVFMNLHVRDL